MDKEIKVLVIEDYEDDAELMILELNRSGYKIKYEVVDNESSLITALRDKKWDAIISDYKLPGFNALAALKTMQQMDLDLPFIIVSGTIGEELAVEAMKAGAHDYIMKNNLRRLTPALEREIREADIRSQRKESSRRLHEQELLLRSLVDFLPIGLVLIDQNKNILIANREFRNTWGEDFSFNDPLSDIPVYDPDSGQRILKNNLALIKAIEDGGKTINEIILIKLPHNTAPKIVLSSVVPITEGDGSPQYAIMLNQDITKLKKDELQLKQTLLELERSNRELEQFAYVASHDLQEPLRMIASFTQLLSKKYKNRLDSDADEYIGFAVEGAKRMQQLINDLLNYSRTTSYNKNLEYIDLNDLINSIIDEMKVVIIENCAEISFDRLPGIMGNRMQIKQLLQNLISNAIKFRKEVSPIVKISCDDRPSEWLFTVRDNGIGIHPVYHEKIFTIFQRLHDRDKYPGTGIGLALCKKIVEQLGGHIWVDSFPNEGSAFHFTLPK